MHFHLPKPLHGWRAFAGEVGIIVVGVLIALGAEQVVAHLRAKAQVRETENAMKAELLGGDLPQAFARAAVHDCLSGQLDRIQAAVGSGGDRNAALALARGYAPVFRTWDDEAWKAALASQAFAETGTGRMVGWSIAYGPMPVLTQEATEEQAELPELRASFSGSGPLTAAQQDRLFHAIAVLRADNARITGGSTVFMKFAADIGLTLPAAEKAQILDEARQKYGACVKTPSIAKSIFAGQFSTARPNG